MINIERRRVMNSSDTNLENTEIKSCKKSNKGLIVILILIILGLGGYICYDKLIMKEDSSKVVENKEEDKNDFQSEAIVNEPEVISALTEKLDLLVDFENFINDKNYWTIYTDLKLSNETKLHIALVNSNIYQIDVLEPENQNYDMFLTKESIEMIYEEIWGEEIQDFEDFSGCPQYLYSEEHEEYYILWECGDVYNDQLHSYISKITENNGEYYVYQSVGVISFDDKVTIYESADMKNLIKESNDYNDDFQITKDNYKQFSEYRFTFKLDDSGVYKITNIERLK